MKNTMEGGRRPVDLVFVFGPTSGRSKRAISRYIRRVSQSSNGLKVASVYFQPNNMFQSRIIDFTDTTSCKMSELPQVQGNPLQHVTKLSFRDDAVKICFLMTNTLPFNDSYNGDETRQQDNENNEQFTEKSNSKPEEIYQEDPLLTCRCLAAMGVAMYCIGERNYYATFCREIYAAFTYITGGQLILLDNITSLHKMLQNIVMEEISLENQVGQVRDYLCVAWHNWGRREARVPANLEVLTDNILNHFHDRNIMTHEVLVGGNAPEKPSKLAKEIAKAFEVNEARSIISTQENWSAELNWIAEEHDEVIPGYNVPPPKEEITDVSVSELKLVTRNQISRLLIRVLSRRPHKKVSHHSLTCVSDSNKKNQSPEGTKQSNGSPFTSPTNHKVDRNNNIKSIEETVLKTKKECKNHESIVIKCQNMTLCSVA